EATGRADQAHELVIDLKRRVAAVEQATAGVSARPRVVCLEWLDPLYVAGHWVPEMVAIAGGNDVLGQPGERAFRVSWEQILAQAFHPKRAPVAAPHDALWAVAGGVRC